MSNRKRTLPRRPVCALENLETRRLLSSVAEFAYLSDLAPLAATNGYGPVELDQSNGEDSARDGRQLKINGTRYTKGLGVHADSELRYALNADYRSFIADVGIDDEVGREGSARFQVFADGEKMFDSGVMTGMHGAKRVNVDLSGKNELVLKLLDAGDGNTNDHGNWAGARIVRHAGNVPVVFSPDNVVLNEGMSFLSVSGSFADSDSESFTATVDFGDGDGRQKLSLNDDKTFNLSHFYDATVSADYTVTIRISDGSATGVGRFKVRVENLAPQFVGLMGGDENGTHAAFTGLNFKAQGIFSDPGTFNGELFIVSVDYGDGSPARSSTVSGRFFGVQHTYKLPGTYTITSRVTDSAGNVGIGMNNVVVADPKWQYLSDVTPTAIGGNEAFGKDRTVGGNQMKINGTRYTKGVGVQADSELVYQLDGAYRHLIADVGVDDEVGRAGSVKFEIFADGDLIFQSRPMTGMDGARRVNVDLTGHFELKLVVTHVGNGVANAFDHANWAGIRIV